MRENDIRKPISIPKQVFHISDDEGNHKDFTVKKIDKTVLYTADDIEAILDTLQFVIQEAVKAGEEISIRDIALKIKDLIGFKGQLLWDSSKPDGTLRKLTDVSKLHSLGWHHRIGIDEGIARLYKWYLEER